MRAAGDRRGEGQVLNDLGVVYRYQSLWARAADCQEQSLGIFRELDEPLGQAKVITEGSDATILALAAMVPRAVDAASRLSAEHGIGCSVVDVRSLVPLDTRTILAEVAKTGRLFTVEENPRLCGWGAEIASMIQEEIFNALKGPIVRITTPHVPLPAADQLEDAVVPSVARIVAEIRSGLDSRRAA